MRCPGQQLKFETVSYGHRRFGAVEYKMAADASHQKESLGPSAVLALLEVTKRLLC